MWGSDHFIHKYNSYIHVYEWQILQFNEFALEYPDRRVIFKLLHAKELSQYNKKTTKTSIVLKLTADKLSKLPVSCGKFLHGRPLSESTLLNLKVTIVHVYLSLARQPIYKIKKGHKSISLSLSSKDTELNDRAFTRLK